MNRDIVLQETGSAHRTLIERMYQLHRYDLSEYNGYDIGNDGTYEHTHLDRYFRNDSYGVFLVFVDESIAGFILVNHESHKVKDEWVRNLDDFFILRKFRRKGIGTLAALELFTSHPGLWQVNKKTGNLPSMSFWPKVIPRCAEGTVFEQIVHGDIHIHYFRAASSFTAIEAADNKDVPANSVKGVHETIEQIEAAVYDTIEHDTAEVAIIREYAIRKPGLRIFEPFCGSGRIGIPLIKDGHEYHGMDRSQEMLERFHSKLRDAEIDGRASRLLKGDVLTEPWPDEMDVVILAGNCFYQLSSADDQRTCARKAFESLVPGGMLYIENDHHEGALPPTWYDTGLITTSEVADIDGAGSKLKSFREIVSADIAARETVFRDTVLKVSPDGFAWGKHATWQKHPVSKAEVETMLVDIGFRVLHTFGDRSGNDYTDEAHKAIFIARKDIVE